MCKKNYYQTQTYKIESVCTSRTTMPSHLFRYVVNFSKVPYEYFSVLNEVTIHLIAKLEFMGCAIPDHIYPDISEGKLWSSFLKKNGYNLEDFPTYLHEFIDDRPPVNSAKLYPNELLPDFIKHLNEFWIANHAYKYFEKRAPEVLPYLDKLNKL